MRLEFVEVSGFRGFREKVRVNFGAGFTVISGRNGVGKSTLCDAIEFAILGEVTKYSVASSANETVQDYIWWRGSGSPDRHYVKAGFIDAEGAPFVIHRSREGGADKEPDEIVAALCKGAVPNDPLRQLCKTSVIRDEWIASLSLDLTETQRFDLVRAALGAVEGTGLTAKAREVVSVTEKAAERANVVYADARSQLVAGLAQLADAQNAAANNSDVADALAVLETAVSSDIGDLSQRVDLAQRSLPDRRRRVEGLAEAAFEAREVSIHQNTINDPQKKRSRDAVQDALVVARLDMIRVQSDFEMAIRAYEIEARANDIAASLTTLVDHGERLGRHGDNCPLCAAHRTEGEFISGLADAKARIAALSSGVAEARERLVHAQALAEEARVNLADLEQRWSLIEDDLRALRRHEEAHIEIFERYGLDPRNAAEPEALDLEAATEREALVRLEAALNTLEASKSAAALASVESSVAEMQRRADAVGEQLTRAQGSVIKAKALEKAVKRASSEIVDERLARISPLLNELYQRLRPHANWRTIDYSIRGDVRRFLSLKVGDDLNPQFVFSSGQRRAAGLAFLLSVHLARPWAQWQTLVLDDPVQHIDDFRALHLVEVLSALRQTGRQVVVAVEDEALADLIGRRLLSTEGQLGRRVTIDNGQTGAAEVVAQLDIAPMQLGLLRRMETVQVAG